MFRKQTIAELEEELHQLADDLLINFISPCFSSNSSI